ncbi:DNA cytosine methyltransferase [Carnobacterium maltaromaticum]|uniref:DNA cytosine methyltransferase n=1 Tax=Carnobacterium maltaromaticum TaxID=2751 RepID=UPI00191BAE4D|nr:DNA cytosine methyltransferase [Carnobacterium maltaromaticum]CAD5900209.1 Cytosine-specific methyltransferase [Carnobacterium maltaromaticum]
MKKIKLATVFSGIGAVEHALERMNMPFEIVFASDNGDRELSVSEENIKDELNKLTTNKEKKDYIDSLYEKSRRQNFVQKTYFENYDIDKDRYHQDVRFINGFEYQNDVDLFVGGSPCQSFSMVGKRGGFEDTRGTLFYEFARLVSEIQPKVFIYENVKGVLNHDNGNTWEIMQNVFDDLGYTWDFKVLNAKKFGVPQNRERIFVVGFLEKPFGDAFNFPQPVELKSVMSDFLENNISEKYYLGTKGIDFVTSKKNLNKQYTQINGEIGLCQKANQQFNWHGDFRFEPINSENGSEIEEKYYLSEKLVNYVMSPGTKGFYSKPEIDLEIARPLLSTMTKMHRAGVDNYVTTQGRIRKLTPRECLRLMGFCDSFKIAVSDTQVYRQSGNSIVVDVLGHVLSEIFKTEVFCQEKQSEQLSLI